jgi:hypothetical protein
VSGWLRSWLLGADLPTRRATTKEAIQSGLVAFPLSFGAYTLVCWLPDDDLKIRTGILIALAAAVGMIVAARLLPIVLIAQE